MRWQLLGPGRTAASLHDPELRILHEAHVEVCLKTSEKAATFAGEYNSESQEHILQNYQ